MVSYLLSVMVVAATITCEISGQEKYQEHLTSGERESKCQSQQAAGRRHADVLRCSFQVDVNNFHVQFYPEGSFNKNVPDMDVVVSCSSSCEIPEAFKDYIFINQSVFHSSEDHTYTFDVLPSKTTNGSFMCQAFHEADTLFTDFCNVSDHIPSHKSYRCPASRVISSWTPRGTDEGKQQYHGVSNVVVVAVVAVTRTCDSCPCRSLEDFTVNSPTGIAM
ncbi:uncharacterized protein LOC112572572 [Pomacea canaliculata]|uniref:uncharacterized protein LOC112572572 n=1 Tax=Pomacea canaliculata TaxID=400727 RepID=UPI000D73E652|nr:uncharacterized protein LOC112572572 [Pomacea canaliculata]